MTTVDVPKITTGNVTGPASYTAGGFTVDLSTNFAFLDYLRVETAVPGVLPAVMSEVKVGQDAAGATAPAKAAVRLMRARHDVFSVGNVTGQPAGVTVAAAKTAAGTTTGSGHTHAIDHDHGSFTSGQMENGDNGDNTVAGGGNNLRFHTHTIDPPAFIGASSETTHTHDRSFEYAHDHSVGTATATVVAAVEVAAGTDLSGTTWRFLAVGQG